MTRLDLSLLVKAARGALVGNRRARLLATHVADAIPIRGTLLEVGCGDGTVATALMRLRPDLRVAGLDTAVQPDAAIPVAVYDGQVLPYDNDAFDYVLLSGVLTRAPNRGFLLVEAARVAARGVVVYDHVAEGRLARPALRALQRLGGHRTAGPADFLTRREWQALFARARLSLMSEAGRLGLYLPPLDWLFGRRLHFVALLVRANG
jgi:SAM-dependent methyltransferase